MFSVSQLYKLLTGSRLLDEVSTTGDTEDTGDMCFVIGGDGSSRVPTVGKPLTRPGYRFLNGRRVFQAGRGGKVLSESPNLDFSSGYDTTFLSHRQGG